MTTLDDGWRLATTVTALAAAASGGAFLTFSTLTTRALADLPPRDGLAAMQQTNLAAPRSPLFMALVFGPALLAIPVAIRAIRHWGEPGSAYVVAGAAVYVVGVVAMTAGYHVPRNDLLATKGPAFAADGWSAWLHAWVVGNHVRTAGGLLAAVLIGLGARAGVAASASSGLDQPAGASAGRSVDLVRTGYPTGG